MPEFPVSCFLVFPDVKSSRACSSYHELCHASPVIVHYPLFNCKQKRTSPAFSSLSVGYLLRAMRNISNRLEKRKSLLLPQRQIKLSLEFIFIFQGSKEDASRIWTQ